MDPISIKISIVKEQITMEKNVNMVASIVKRNANDTKPSISECPDKLGDNAFGLSESYLPLECQFNWINDNNKYCQDLIFPSFEAGWMLA